MIDIPAKAVEFALTDGLSLAVKMTPTGHVCPILNGRNEPEIASSAVWANTTIDCLVAQALSSENLRLEEAGSAELSILQQQLERATSLVKRTIERLTNPSEGISEN
ncbi:hypothetical protein [Bradyrhizobium sp. AZCC 1693]|uniref:hypothetical protein n=1 Tax=Bradyrhizobium sp. AZCC 1693 TaxID=3117029 RepID=UPI002FF287F4